jgi:DNA-binding CsgD family transcriptional regulator
LGGGVFGTARTGVAAAGCERFHLARARDQSHPLLAAHHHGCEAAARAGLGETHYRACWEEGYTLGRGQEVAAALEDTVPPEQRKLAVTSGEDAFELTARELEVAKLVADGLSNPAIAAALFVSVATVKTHVSHILGKLGLQSRVQLAAWVADHSPGPALPGHR